MQPDLAIIFRQALLQRKLFIKSSVSSDEARLSLISLYLFLSLVFTVLVVEFNKDCCALDLNCSGLINLFLQTKENSSEIEQELKETCKQAYCLLHRAVHNSLNFCHHGPIPCSLRFRQCTKGNSLTINVTQKLSWSLC